MKKAISIALSICVLLASFSGVILGTALADVPNSSYFVNPDNWTIYNNNGTLGGDAGDNNGWMYIANQHAFEGKDVVIQALVRDKITAFPFEVEADKNYTLSFKYFVDSAATITSFKSFGVYTEGATFANEGEYFSGGEVLGTVSPNYVSGQWYEVKIDFKSKSNTTVYFAAYWLITNQTINFADFALTEKLPEVNYYELAANWKLYNNNGTLGGAAGDNNGWMSFTNAYLFEGKDVVLQALVRDKISALPFSVEANKNYTLSFKYFVDGAATMTSLKSVGVYAPDSTFNEGNYASGGEVLGTATPEVASGEWKEVTIDFKSKSNTTVYLAAYWLISDQTINFADFSLTKKAGHSDASVFENASNWTIYNNNGTLGGAAGDNNGWMAITNVNDFQGKDVVVQGLVRDKVSALAFVVEPSKYYELKFKYFVDSAATMTSLKSVGVYAPDSTFNEGNYASGGEVLGTAAPEVVSGEWKDVTVAFGSANNTTVYLAAYWLVSDQIINFADFELTEVDNDPNTSVFEKVSNWKIYKKNSAGQATPVLGEGVYNDGWENVSLVTDYEGKSKAVKLLLGTALPAVTFDVEANKSYSLTFKYFVPTTTTLSGYMGSDYINTIGVYADGTIFDGNSYTANYALGTPASVDTSVNGAWTEVEIEFPSIDNTKLHFAAYCSILGACEIYFADFELKEIDKELHVNNIPAKGWRAYKEATSVFGDGGALHPGVIEEVTNKNYGGADDQDNKSIRIDGNNIYQWATKKLEGLETDSYYKLTMYYWSPSAGSDGSMFSELRVVKDGGKNKLPSADNLGLLYSVSSSYTNKYGLEVTLSDTGTGLYKPKTTDWNKLELYFYSGDATTAHLVMRPISSKTPLQNAAANAESVYVDGISIEKTSSDNFRLNDQKPNPGWGSVRDEYEINFDDEDFYVHLQASEQRMKIEKAPERDGKSTNALHILPGTFNSVTCLNWTTVTTRTDPVFTMPVEVNQKYSFSYWMYLEEDQDPLNYMVFYYDYADSNSGRQTYTTHTSMQDFGKWVRFETLFFTDPNQTSCSIFFNMGAKPGDLWIDDIALLKIDAGTVVSEPDKSYCETSYNMITGDNLADIKAAKSGVYKFNLKKNVTYLFGATVGSTEKSDSRLMLSFDGTNPMGQIGRSAPSPIIEANGKMERYGINFDSGSQESIYVVIDNDDGKLQIEDPYLFIAYYTTPLTHKGYASDPNAEFVTHKGPLGSFGTAEVDDSDDSDASDDSDKEDTQNSGIGESINDTQSDDNSQDTDDEQDVQDVEIDESPETGSVPVSPIIILFITTLFACILLSKTKRGGEQI